MRSLSLVLTLSASLAAAGCSASYSTNNANGAASNAPSRPAATANTVAPGSLPSVSSAHGGGGGESTMPPAAPAGSAAKPSVDTAAFDAKIEKTEAKAKAKGATPADKLAAAAAYVARGNFYFNAQTPALYKFALGDFRRALRYQPDNEEAQTKRDELVRIYQDMGRPVPENGNEP